MTDRASIHRLQAMRVPATICLALLGFAFVAGVRSCEWGLDAYFVVGVVTLLVLAITPWALQRQTSMRTRVWLSLGWALAGFVAWILGFALAGFRLLCRLM